MNTEENMPRVSISMTKKQLEKLDKIKEKEHRKRSEQIVHMMEFYLDHNSIDK